MTQSRPLPHPSPETAPFWEAAKRNELHLQRCAKGCGQAYFPPRPFCPHCGSRKTEWFRASGCATLHSYIISHRAAPGFTAPYAVAVVELEEGPRMMTNIVGCEQSPEALRLDMPLIVVFEPQSDTITLPFFAPASED